MVNHEHVREESPLPVLVGLLIGGLAGAGTMLLLAPQSGKETRELIKQKSIELHDRTVDNVETAVTQIKSAADQLTSDVSEKTKELKHQGQAILIEQLDRVSAVVKAGNGSKAVEGS